MHVVLDTNILVSAAIKPKSHFAKALRQGAFTLIITEPLLKELIAVLNRSKLRDKYHLTPHYIHAFLQLIGTRGEFFEPGEKINLCRDPKDNMFLEAAVAGLARVIVSKDRDLLDLVSFRSIPIIEPKNFLQTYL